MSTPPHALWYRWTQGRKALGGWAALLSVADRVLRRLHGGSSLRLYHFLAQPIAEHPVLDARRGLQYSFRLLTAADPALAALGRPEAVIAQRFAQGAQCLLSTRGKRLAGCLWWVFGRYREDEVRADYQFPADCVWDFDVYVAPLERMGVLFAKQWDVANALLRQRGVRYSLSRVNALNRHSLASHQRLGALPCGWALFVSLGPAQFMLASVRPFVRWGGRPCLRLHPPKDAAGAG